MATKTTSRPVPPKGQPQRQAPTPQRRPEPPAKGQRELVKAGEENLPAHLQERMAEHSGAGVSTNPDDNLVPMVDVLQDQSPMCKQSDREHYDPNRSPGEIWLKKAGDDVEFVPGEQGILVQPCFFEKAFVEWIPRGKGGGFVAKHSSMPEDAEKHPSPEDPNSFKWVRRNGNEVIETRYHVVLVHLDDGRRMPYVIPMKGSGHTVSRGWMFMMNNKSLPGGSKAPSFARLYRLTTEAKSNQKGSWFQFHVEDEGWVASEADYESGLALHNTFFKGEKEMDYSTEGRAEPAGNDGDM